MNIVVLGDVLLDVDLDGTATRLCPDAPVPVVDVATAKVRAGGAGLVARMLADGGNQVRLVTALGDDEPADRLRTELSGIPLVAGPSGSPTPTKTRLRAGGHPVARFDQGCQDRPAPAVTAEMLEALDGAGVLVVADYGRGLTSNPALRARLARLAPGIPIVWDPHPAGAAPVPGVAVVTPNQSEARAAAEAAKADPALDGSQSAAALLRHWQSQAVLLTQGADGAVLVQAAAPAAVRLPAPRTRVTDACGAGDRLAASLAARLLEGATLEKASRRAVQEASAFLAAGGVAALPPVTGGPASWIARQAPDPLALARRVRASGGTVVATGGCFDLLHAGHARTLAAARSMGACLIVCLNSDDSARRLKGDSRPIIPQEDRAELLLSLNCVDAVLVFDEDTPEQVLARLRPDIWVKGGDYDADLLPESGLVRSWGGRCLSVPYHPARSTTGLAAALARVG
jgi:rfaE bifunctional protein nucleotidyltransferase chain/domain/rfaE bifunctional protein kinase chain/domain